VSNNRQPLAVELTRAFIGDIKDNLAVVRACLALAAIGFAFQRIADWICVAHHVSQTDAFRVLNPVATSLLATGLTEAP